MLLVACSDCECKVINGKPNFNVKMSYKMSKSGITIFSNDTLMVRYKVTVNPYMKPQLFIGELNPSSKDINGKPYIIWYDGNTGQNVNNETADALALCLKISGWRNDAEMEEYADPQGIRNVISPDSALKPTKVELIEP